MQVKDKIRYLQPTIHLDSAPDRRDWYTSVIDRLGALHFTLNVSDRIPVQKKLEYRFYVQPRCPEIRIRIMGSRTRRIGKLSTTQLSRRLLYSLLACPTNPRIPAMFEIPLVRSEG